MESIKSENLRQFLSAESLTEYGCCRFDALADSLFSCRAAARLPENARTVIVMLFPYRFPDLPDVRRNISRYACVPDYHTAAGAVLHRLTERLAAAFPRARFAAFADNSPIPEVKAAAMAGLGVIGDHQLLINPVYGSWVFIAEIVTDAAVLPEPSEINELPGCLHCGRCSAACPGSCIGGGRDTCLSAVTQKKGELTAAEAEMLRRGGTAWGCDRCQEVCPLNRGTKIAPHPCFDRYEPILSAAQLEGDLKSRAYGWRGRAVPARNLHILEAADHEADTAQKGLL